MAVEAHILNRTAGRPLNLPVRYGLFVDDIRRFFFGGYRDLAAHNLEISDRDPADIRKLA